MKCVVACNLGSYLKTDVGISTRRCMGALQFMMLSVIDGVLTIETEHSLALFSDAIMLSTNFPISLYIIYQYLNSFAKTNKSWFWFLARKFVRDLSRLATDWFNSNAY